VRGRTIPGARRVVMQLRAGLLITEQNRVRAPRQLSRRRRITTALTLLSLADSLVSSDLTVRYSANLVFASIIEVSSNEEFWSLIPGFRSRKLKVFSFVRAVIANSVISTFNAIMFNALSR